MTATKTRYKNLLKSKLKMVIAADGAQVKHPGCI
jgi:hypothetical protein